MRKCWYTILLAVNLAVAQPGASTKYVVHTPEVELSYYVYGNTHSVSPVIVVNGGPGFDHRYMVQSDIWNTLAQRRQIVFYDQRGVGESKLINPEAEQTMAAQVADIEAIRLKLGVNHVCLLGDSWGGFVSMGYAAAHPEHVEVLVLVDSVDAYWGKNTELFTQMFPDIRPKDPKPARQRAILFSMTKRFFANISACFFTTKKTLPK
jgi:proline iminopeptidase